MSDGVMGAVSAGSLFAGAMRLYLAPVDRVNALPAAFSAGAMGRFALDAPPAGWMSAGVVTEFARSTGESLKSVWSGAPATVKTQVRASVAEEVSFTFAGWTRVAMALSAGVPSMNLLKAAPDAAPVAMALLAGSTATVLQVAADSGLQVGDVVIVDADYAGQTGYVGAGAAGAALNTAEAARVDVHYVRRVSFNLGLVVAVRGSAVTLAAALPAGVPDAAMKVGVVEGFADRNGGAFVPEWSALFVLDGVQGDRLLWHYPRLQPAGDGVAETRASLATGVDRWRPAARLRALPVADSVDGVLAVSYRNYFPAPMRAV